MVSPKSVDQALAPLEPPFVWDPRVPGSDAPPAEVEVLAIADATGVIRFPKIAASAPPLLASAIVEAASFWKFRPAVKDGHPVDTVIKTVLKFPKPSNRILGIDEVDMPPIHAKELKPVPRPRPTSTEWTSAAFPRPLFPDRRSSPLPPFNGLMPAVRSFSAGETLIRYVVERDGSVSSVDELWSTNEAWTARVIATVRKQRFAPGRRLGQPARVYVVDKFIEHASR